MILSGVGVASSSVKSIDSISHPYNGLSVPYNVHFLPEGAIVLVVNNSIKSITFWSSAETAISLVTASLTRVIVALISAVKSRILVSSSIKLLVRLGNKYLFILSSS